MRFWEKVRSSFYSPAFYAGIATQPVSSAFKFYFSIAAVLSLLISAVLSFQLIPVVQEFSTSTINDFVATIPEGLALSVQGNDAYTNASSTEPIFFNTHAAVPAENFTYLVIDTRQNFSIEQFQAYRTFVWVAHNGVGFVDEGSKVSFQPFEGVESFTMTRDDVVELVHGFRSYAWIFYALLIPGIFFVAFLYYVAVLLWLVFGAILVWGVARIRGIELRFKNTYAIALYAVSLGLVVRCILFLFVPTPIPVPFFFTIIFLVSVIANLEPRAFATKPQ